MIERYIMQREQLKAVVLLVDIRHAPSAEDVMMYEWLKHYEIPVIVVATKCDKIPKGKWEKHLKVVRDTLKKHPDDPLIKFSSETGQGKDEAWGTIMSYIKKK
jgi:GTP-binding protein